MKITHFWIVTKPNSLSTIDDICFETDMIGLEKQFKGGLKAEDIAGTYIEETEAREKAVFLISHTKICPNCGKKLFFHDPRMCLRNIVIE